MANNATLDGGIWGGWYVMLLWFLQWLGALLFSRWCIPPVLHTTDPLRTHCRYARWQAQGGSSTWARWALMPGFEVAIVVKKVALVVIYLSWGLTADTEYALCIDRSLHSAAVAFGMLFLGYGMGLYVFSYSGVFVVLAAQSVGTRTLKRAGRPPDQSARSASLCALRSDWIVCVSFVVVCFYV